MLAPTQVAQKKQNIDVTSLRSSDASTAHVKRSFAYNIVRMALAPTAFLNLIEAIASRISCLWLLLRLLFSQLQANSHISVTLVVQRVLTFTADKIVRIMTIRYA